MDSTGPLPLLLEKVDSEFHVKPRSPNSTEGMWDHTPPSVHQIPSNTCLCHKVWCFLPFFFSGVGQGFVLIHIQTITDKPEAANLWIVTMDMGLSMGLWLARTSGLEST